MPSGGRSGRLSSWEWEKVLDKAAVRLDRRGCMVFDGGEDGVKDPTEGGGRGGRSILSPDLQVGGWRTRSPGGTCGRREWEELGFGCVAGLLSVGRLGRDAETRREGGRGDADSQLWPAAEAGALRAGGRACGGSLGQGLTQTPS